MHHQTDSIFCHSEPYINCQLGWVTFRVTRTFLITVVGGRVTVRLLSKPKIPLLGIPTAGVMMPEEKVLALLPYSQLGFWLGMRGGLLEGFPEGFFDSLGLLEGVLEGLLEGLPEMGFALGLLVEG